MPKGDREILKADPEDGTTPIANLLLEALAVAKLTGKEKGAVLYLWRVTYGWCIAGTRLKEQVVSLRRWAEVLDTDKSKASTILTGLVRKNVVKRKLLGAGKGYSYSMNTRVAEWDNGCLNQERLSEMAKQPFPKKATVPLPKMATPSDTKLASRKEILNKSKKSNTDKDRGKAEEIWGKCLNILKERVSQPNYRTWLEGTGGLLYGETMFIIGVPREQVGEYLMTHQRSLLEKTLIEITGKRLGIGYRVVSKVERKQGDIS